jgi:hypothetical protein
MMIYKTIHTKIKDRGTRTPLNMWDEHGYYSVNDAPTSLKNLVENNKIEQNLLHDMKLCIVFLYLISCVSL